MKNRTILIQGLLLPFRLYFQPKTLLNYATRVPQQWELYVIAGISLLWIPISYALGWLVDRTVFETSSPSTLILLVSMGVLLGVRIHHLNEKMFFSWSFVPLLAIGVVFSIVMFWNSILLENIAREHNMSIARVVDHPSLDQPAINILALGIGLSISLMFNQERQRQVIFYSALIGIGLCILFSFGPKPAINTSNVTAVAIATFTLTRAIFQPLFILMHIVILSLGFLVPKWSPALWRFHPVSWCEFTYFPLPGLVAFVTRIYVQNNETGEMIANQISHHPFYYPLAKRIRAEFVYSDNNQL